MDLEAGVEARTHLDVGVQVHERPLAVARVDAQSQLHLLVQHDKDANSLLLKRGKHNLNRSGFSVAAKQPMASLRLRRLSLHPRTRYSVTPCINLLSASSRPSARQFQPQHLKSMSCTHVQIISAWTSDSNHLTFSPSWSLDLCHRRLRPLSLQPPPFFSA